VAIDADHKTIPIPPVIPETDEDKRRYKEAGERRSYRLEQRTRAKS